MEQRTSDDKPVLGGGIISPDVPFYTEIIRIAQECLEHIHDKDLAIIAFEAIVARM